MNLDMTLREYFELAERMDAATRVIRDAQAMLGGVTSQWPSGEGRHGAMAMPWPHPGIPTTDPAKCGMCGEVGPHECSYAHAAATQQRRSAGPTTNKGPVVLSADEMATRERLRRARETEEPS